MGGAPEQASDRAPSPPAADAAPQPAWQRACGAVSVVAGGAAAALAYGESLPMQADEMVHPPHHHWSHSGMTDTFDMTSVRRGYEVYKQVCSACHSMDRIAFRNLIDTVYPEEKCKELAAEYDYVNKEPGDDGEMFTRKGKVFDCACGSRATPPSGRSPRTPQTSPRRTPTSRLRARPTVGRTRPTSASSPRRATAVKTTSSPCSPGTAIPRPA